MQCRHENGAVQQRNSRASVASEQKFADKLHLDMGLRLGH